MPPARTSRRYGLAASASSSSIASPSAKSQRQDGPLTPGTATRLAGPSTSRATPRSIGPSSPASDAQIRQSAETESTPTKSPASNSFNDPIVIDDSDDDADRVGATQPLSSFSPSSIGNPDESTSTTTLDQSYATSLTSDLNMISDGTLTSVSSDESDSDIPEKSAPRGLPFATPPRRLTRAVRSSRAEITATPVSSTGREAPSQTPSDTPTPSRRSARIVSSGSSVKKALQRRDELDAKLLASPVRRKPDASDPPSSPPIKRLRRRPRESATENSPVQTQASPATVQPPANAPVQISSPATSRRSARLSLPTAAELKDVQAKAAKKAGSESQEPETQPKRGRRSHGGAVLAESPPVSVDGSQVAEVPPAKRGPGRPRRIAPNEEPTVSSAPSSPAKEQDNERSPRRKRGRPRKEALDEAMDEDHGASPADIDSRSVQAEADAIARQQAIDMLDENVSELSDASEESLDSSAPSHPAALPRRRGRPPKDRSLDGDSVKRVSRPEKGGKKFHVSGLYAGEADATPSVSSTKPTEAQNVVLPNPIHFGAQLLIEERDFCLPYPDSSNHGPAARKGARQAQASSLPANQQEQVLLASQASGRSAFVQLQARQRMWLGLHQSHAPVYLRS
ncbi:hypothetical protein L1887_56967 [Cichorium endivia]|nr:hypothetical protein L1887_56967 [Cichorium endivia]